MEGKIIPMDINRISACTYPVRTEPLDYTFELISRSGYRKIDLWGGPPNYANDPAKCDIGSLKQKCTDYEVRIDNAAALGSRSIRVSPGHGEDPDIIPGLILFFTESAKYAAGRNVYLGFENHQGSIAANPADIMTLIEAVGSPYLGILYEPANLMACRVDYKTAYERFADHVVHVHIKDGRWLISVLEKAGYTGDYSVEFEIEDSVSVEQGLPDWLSFMLSI